MLLCHKSYKLLKLIINKIMNCESAVFSLMIHMKALMHMESFFAAVCSHFFFQIYVEILHLNLKSTLTCFKTSMSTRQNKKSTAS